MKKTVHKVTSQFMAIAIILSMLVLPAFAEEKTTHTHSYNIEAGTETSVSPYSSTHHIVTTITRFVCECGMPDDPDKHTAYRYAKHTSAGSGTLDHSYTDPITGATVYYYSFTCSECGDSFIKEVH